MLSGYALILRVHGPLMQEFVSTVSIRVATDKHKKHQSQGHTSGNELVS